MRARRLVTLLSWVPTLPEPTVMGGLLGKRSKHRTELGPQVLRAWSPSLDGDLDSLLGVERVGLACVWGTSEAYVFGYSVRLHLICESPFLRDGTT
jgi:hypothetical protein